MDRLEFLIPQGTRDFLPDRAAALTRIEQVAFQVFQQWGFRPIITPSFEYLEVLSLGSGEDLEALAFKFNDRASGRVLAMTPDFTPQVARVVATRMGAMPKPLRLYYGGRVLRDTLAAPGRPREIFQAGVELIGLDSPEADAEMIAMAIECLKRLGLKDFKIDVGQVGFIRAALREAGLSKPLQAQVKEALARKDTARLQELLGSAKEAELLLALPQLYGDKEVIEGASQLARGQAGLAALDNLRQVVEIVEIYGLADRISLDLGELRGFDYHSGVIFEGFVSGQGFAVLRGGRYDNLLGQYGQPLPATGFALDLEALLLAAESQGLIEERGGPDFLIINLKQEKREALELARSLREKGYRVARDIIKRDVLGSLDYARRNGIRKAILLGRADCSAGELVVIDLEKEGEEKLLQADLLAG